jgi:geranylgeranyl transferase type-2 subunit alpha
MVNPKCYGAWYHRKWVMRFGLSSLDAEFVLLKKLLKLDARNFHGWNYRRYFSYPNALALSSKIDFAPVSSLSLSFSNQRMSIIASSPFCMCLTGR